MRTQATAPKLKFLKKAEELQPQPCIRGLIYGVPGIGKTTLVGTLPKPLVVIDFEGGAGVRLAGLPDTYIAEVHNYSQLVEVLNELDSIPEIRSIAFDGFSVFVESLLDEITAQRGRETPTFREWNTLTNLIKKVVLKLRKPQKNLVFTALEKRVKKGDETYIFPALPNSIRLYLEALVDVVGRVCNEINEPEIAVDFVGLCTSDHVEVKDRSGKLGVEPPYFEDIIKKFSAPAPSLEELFGLEKPTGGEEEKPSEPPITDKQKAYIHKLVKDLGWDEEKYRSWLFDLFRKRSSKELTKHEAKLAIDQLLTLLEEKEGGK